MGGLLRGGWPETAGGATSGRGDHPDGHEPSGRDHSAGPCTRHAGQQRLLLPHAVQRLAAIPVVLAIAWLDYALLTERRARASEPATSTGSPQLRRIAAE